MSHTEAVRATLVVTIAKLVTATQALEEVRDTLSRPIGSPHGETYVAELYGLDDLFGIVLDALEEVG